MAKKIIEEKVHQIHSKDQRTPEEGGQDSGYVQDFEKSLKRLNELQSIGKITQKEFKNKRKQLLKKHY